MRDESENKNGTRDKNTSAEAGFANVDTRDAGQL